MNMYRYKTHGYHNSLSGTGDSFNTFRSFFDYEQFFIKTPTSPYPRIAWFGRRNNPRQRNITRTARKNILQQTPPLDFCQRASCPHRRRGCLEEKAMKKTLALITLGAIVVTIFCGCVKA